jgi:hypothetical protein
MIGMFTNRKARATATIVAIPALLLCVWGLAGCGEEKIEAPQPDVSQATQPDPTPAPPAEEPLTDQEQKNLAVSYSEQAAQEITQENAESIADALEKEIEADQE